MNLISVYDPDVRESAERTLYDLLAERTPQQSISHRAMPTWDEHRAFVASQPYLAWYIIRVQGATVGACYLSRQREIGIGIFRASRRRGYAKQAVSELMRLHPGRFLANIAPGNAPSYLLFKELGFGAPIQITLERRP